MSRSRFRCLCLGLGSALVLLGVSGGGFYFNLGRLADGQQRLRRSQAGLGELQELGSLLKDAETGQRGYLLTGKVEYLQPYRVAIDQMQPQISQVRRAIQDSPEQQAQLRRLEPAIAQRLTELRDTLKLRQSPGLEAEKAARQLAQTDQGQQLMTTIRRQVKTMATEQQRLVELRSQELSAHWLQAGLTFGGLNGLAALLLGLVLYWIWRDRPDRHSPTKDSIAPLVERYRPTALPPEPIDLIQIIEASLGQLTTYLHGRNAEVRVAQPLPIVLAQRPVLLQAVTHLLDQALKSVPFDRQPVVQIYAAEAQNSMCLWIEDNSDGSLPAELEGSDGSPGSCPPATIGLAIVRAGLERWGGEVGVESQSGQGNRFWIALPTVDRR